MLTKLRKGCLVMTNKYKRKIWTMNTKRYNSSTLSRCLSLDMGLACGYTFTLFNEVKKWD